MIDIRKTYRSRSRISEITLSCELGGSRIIGLYGPSGVGKTTVLKVLAGLEEKDVCKAILGGKSIQEFHQNKDVSIVFQDAFLPMKLTVKEALNLLTVDSERKFEAVRKLDVEAFENDRIKNLSQGQRQRAAIVACLYSGKNLILMDEPFSAIGDNHINMVCEILRQEIDQSQSRIALICSHRRDILDMLCGEIISM